MREALLPAIGVDGGNLLPRLEQRGDHVHRARRLAGTALCVGEHDHMRRARCLGRDRHAVYAKYLFLHRP